MAAFVIDNDLRNAIESVISAENVSDADKQLLEHDLASGFLRIDRLKMVENLQKSMTNEEGIASIVKFIKGKKLVFPDFKVEPVVETKEQKLRRQNLQNRADQRDYNRMVYGTELAPADQEVLSVSRQLTSVRNQISIGVNMIVAIFATFGICYYVGGQYSDNTSSRMIYGLIGGILVMILEMVLYIIRAGKMEEIEHKINEKNNKVVESNKSTIHSEPSRLNNNSNSRNSDSHNSNAECEVTSLDVTKSKKQL